MPESARPFEVLSRALGEALSASTRPRAPKSPKSPKSPLSDGSTLSEAISHHYDQEDTHADDNQ